MTNAEAYQYMYENPGSIVCGKDWEYRITDSPVGRIFQARELGSSGCFVTIDGASAFFDEGELRLPTSRVRIEVETDDAVWRDDFKVKRDDEQSLFDAVATIAFKYKSLKKDL